MSTSPTTDERAGTLVLAVGNPLMGDDGLGAAVLARLRAWEWPPDLELVDGELWGMRLLPLIEAADRLLVVDAIDVGAAPGTYVSLGGAEVPRRLDARLSAHEVGLGDVLALAALRGRSPRIVRAVGAQPACLEFGAPLSPEVEGMVDLVADAARSQLAVWGIVGHAIEDASCTR